MLRSGRFEVHGELGRGASGVVFDVVDRQHGRRAALKLASHSGSMRSLHAQDLIRFRREHPHPNLAGLFDVGELDGHLFYLMERLEGTDILSAAQGRPQDAARMFAQLLRGLGAMHAAGWVHRDVTPDNVVVSGDGRVVLLDLDIAVPMGESTLSSSPVGTPQYMSPEQLVGHMLEPASDLYAVGAILFEHLTGLLLHGGEPERRLSEPAPPVRDLRPHADPAMASLCDALLCTQPAARPGLHRALRDLSGYDPEESAPAGCSRHVPFVGREEELDTLLAAYERSKEQAGWLHLHGPAGRGKTRLLQEFTHRLRSGARPPRVVTAAFDERPRSAYGALDTVLAALVTRFDDEPVAVSNAHCLLEVFPSLKPLVSVHEALTPVPRDAHTRRMWAQRSLRELLAGLLRSAQLVLVLDDTQHADIDAQWFIRQWLAEGMPAGLLLVTSGEIPAWSSPVGGHAQEVELPPLPVPQAQELWRQAAEAWSAEQLERPPTAPAEPEALLCECAVRVQGAPASDEKRLEQLPAELRDVLETICAAGRRLSYAELTRCVAGTEPQLALAVHRLSERHWVSWDAHNTTVRATPRVTELVRTHMTEQRRHELDHRLWLAFKGDTQGNEASGAPYAQAADSEVAAKELWEAARRARKVLAFGQAAALATLASRCDAAYCAWAELGELLSLAGRNVEASEAYERALDTANAADRVRLEQRRAELLLCSGNVLRALEAARGVLASVGLHHPKSTAGAIASLIWHKTALSLDRATMATSSTQDIPESELARVDALWATGTLVATTDAVRGLELTTRCTRQALKCGDPPRLARALLYEALNDVVVEKPPFERSQHRVADAVRLLGPNPPPLSLAHMRMVHGVRLFFSGEVGKSVERLREADDLFNVHAVEPNLNHLTTRQFLVQCLLMLTRVREASAAVDGYVREAQWRGDLHAVALLTSVGSVPAHLFAHDDVEGARTILARAMEPWPMDQVYLQHLNELIARMMIMEYERQPGMLQAIDARMHAMRESPVMRAPPVRALVDGFRAYAMVVEALHATGPARERWKKRASKEVKRLQKVQHGFVYRRALSLQPSVHLLDGDRQAAIAALEFAHREFVEAGQDVTWAESLLGRLASDAAGSERAARASARMATNGYANVERALATTGGDLL